MLDDIEKITIDLKLPGPERAVVIENAVYVPVTHYVPNPPVFDDAWHSFGYDGISS